MCLAFSGKLFYPGQRLKNKHGKFLSKQALGVGINTMLRRIDQRATMLVSWL